VSQSAGPGGVESFKLHGERAERFREIRADLTDRLGYKPSKAETIGRVMGEWPPDSRGRH
jgi:hypothetical protein